jgi:hypothetical protein
LRVFGLLEGVVPGDMDKSVDTRVVLCDAIQVVANQIGNRNVPSAERCVQLI